MHLIVGAFWIDEPDSDKAADRIVDALKGTVISKSGSVVAMTVDQVDRQPEAIAELQQNWNLGEAGTYYYDNIYSEQRYEAAAQGRQQARNQARRKGR